MDKKQYKSGFVTLIGRPNVGRSTLMNQLIGQKIAITSNKPQTTRNRIQTVLTTEATYPCAKRNTDTRPENRIRSKKKRKKEDMWRKYLGEK